MPEHWIPAAKALEIAGDERTLCARLHCGLILARAKQFVAAEQSKENCHIPKEFWWAEGDLALEQDWLCAFCSAAEEG